MTGQYGKHIGSVLSRKTSQKKQSTHVQLKSPPQEPHDDLIFHVTEEITNINRIEYSLPSYLFHVAKSCNTPTDKWEDPGYSTTCKRIFVTQSIAQCSPVHIT